MSNQVALLALHLHVKSTITLPLPVLWELCRLASEPEPVVVIQREPKRWVLEAEPVRFVELEQNANVR